MKEENEIVENEAGHRFDPVWLGSCVLVTAVATVLRFIWLDLKPLHHDEGVNGWFLTNLMRDGVYHYDPANYHGPTLYYIALGFAEVFGLNTWSVRSSVAVWGVLTVVLAFFLRRYIGKIGSLFAALFIALSPGMVFISRYFIHEIFFVFLSLGLVLSVLMFIEKRRAGPFAIGWLALILLVCFLPSTLNISAVIADEKSNAIWVWRAIFFVVEAALVFFVIRMLLAWHDGRPVYFLLTAACVSLLFATKETAFITLGTMVLACLSVWIWLRIYGKRSVPSDDREIEDEGLTWKNFSEAFGSGGDRWLLIAASAVVFVYIFILFFSSFFTYAGGIKGAIDAYTIWTKTGSKDHTQNGMWAYLRWGMNIEGPVFLLSAMGALFALAKVKHRFAMFTAFWAFGLFAAYTLIPYKTPWLALSFLLPMCIMAGYGINELVGSGDQRARAAGVLLAIGASVVMAYQTYQLNFLRYDDEAMPYVYAHTKREFLDMLAEIDKYADKSGKGKQAKIQIVSPDYWPMVWYMRDYPNAIFHGKIADADNAEMIVAKKGEQDSDVMRRYAANYEYIGSYALRPGVDLVLLVRRDLAGDEGKELYKIQQK